MVNPLVHTSTNLGNNNANEKSGVTQPFPKTNTEDEDTNQIETYDDDNNEGNEMEQSENNNNWVNQ